MPESTITLSPSKITELLGNTRSRGGYERLIRKFRTSGNMYFDVREDLEFKSKKTPALLTSFTSNVKKLALANPEWPTIKVVKSDDDDTVILVNMDVYEATLDTEDAEDDEYANAQ